jgi:hypothetical protein
MFSGQKSEAEQAVICAKIMQHLAGVYGDEQFRIAMVLVEKEVRFFPTVKDLLNTCEIRWCRS